MSVGLVELWDADYGVDVTAGVFLSWTGRLGNVARPGGAGTGCALNTALFGGRRCISFDGIAGGLRASIPSLRQACGNIAVHVHAYMSLNNATAQSLIRIHDDGAHTRLYMHHPTTTNQLQSEGIDNTVSVNANSWSLGEGVYAAARSYAGFIRQWKNGASGGIVADSTSALYNTADVAIGSNGLLGGWFFGGIRRVAIYTAIHDTTAAAAIDLQWRGY